MVYIEDVFPSFGHNTTHSLVRSDFLRPTRVNLVFKLGALVLGGFFLAFMAFLSRKVYN